MQSLDPVFTKINNNNAMVPFMLIFVTPLLKKLVKFSSFLLLLFFFSSSTWLLFRTFSTLRDILLRFDSFDRSREVRNLQSLQENTEINWSLPCMFLLCVVATWRLVLCFSYYYKDDVEGKTFTSTRSVSLPRGKLWKVTRWFVSYETRDE